MSAWTASDVVEVRGDVHVVRALGDIPARVAVFRYRGAEPLPRFLEQLKSDGDRWRALRHPNLMPTLETGRLPSQITCYWAQEDVPGGSLADRLAIHPLIAPDHALAIARQVGTALTVVHRAELLHGDLGPHNVVLVDAKDRPRLAWGGLALRLEQAGMDAGRSGNRLYETPPELLSGKSFGPPADVYALCALLYRMLAGQPAFTVRRGGPPPGVTATEPLASLPEWVSPEVVRLLSDGLQRDPAKRPDLFELVDRIEDHENHVRGQPVPLGTWSPTAPPPLEPGATPPTVNRTVEPRSRDEIDVLDPTFANTPPSVARHLDRSGLERTGLDRTPATPPFSGGSQSTNPPTRASAVPPGVRSVVPSSAPVVTERSGGGQRTSHRPIVTQPSTSPMLVPASILAGSVVLGLFVFVGLWYFAPRTPIGTPEPIAAVPAPAPTPVVAAPGPSDVAPAPPKAGPAIMTLVTEPTSAEVWEDGRFLGLTPIDVVLDPSVGTRDRTFELKLSGYVTNTVRQPFSDVDQRHTVSLQRIPKPKPAGTAEAKPAPAPKPKPKPELGIKVER